MGGGGRLIVDGGLDVGGGDLAEAGDAACPGVQNRGQGVEVGADGGEGAFRMGAAALAAQNQHPAVHFLGDAVRKGGDAAVEGAFDRVTLAGGVGDDHVLGVQELQHPPDGGAAAGGEGADVGLVDWGLSADPGEQETKGLAAGDSRHGVPAVSQRVLIELLDQCLSCGGEGGQLVQGPDGQAAPVSARVEQRDLRRVDQMRRDLLNDGRAGEPPGPTVAKHHGIG